MDNYKKFGFLTLVISLFFMFMVTHGSGRILFASGILYSFVLLFHSPLEKLFGSRAAHPVRAYGLWVLINGLIIEALAYLSNLDKIRSGQEVFLFSSSSLAADLLIGIPYYLAFAFIFSWAVKKYDFTPLSLGVVIFLGQAMTVDVFSHLIQLFAGNILGFIMAGVMMLFTLHGPIFIFSSKISEQYPNRSRALVRYPLVIVLQLIPLAITFAVVFTKNVILHI